MTFAEIPAGARVFIDANIFIYHFGGQSGECRTLLERSARREVVGYTSTMILAEVLHRLMVAEAIQKGLVVAKGAVRKLAEKPEFVKQLNAYNENVKTIYEMNIVVSNLTLQILNSSQAIRETEGLLTNDSLVIATMRDLSITYLASADSNFEKVAGIELCAPSDL